MNNGKQESQLNFQQIYALRSQIHCYKNLIRNLPVNLDNHIDESMIILQLKEFQQSAIMYNEEKKNERLIQKIKYKKRNDERQYKQFIEKVDYFVKKRINQINNLINRNNIQETTKERLIFEKKFLSCKDVYLRLRQKLNQNLYKEKKTSKLMENNLLDRTYFKRQKILRYRDSISKYDKIINIKSDQEKRRRLKHKDFLHSLYSHQNQFFQYHKKKLNYTKKLLVHVHQMYITFKKKQQTIQQQKQRDRVNILKQNYESYLTVLKQSKNQRILTVLRDTDKYLKQLGAKVKLQKGLKPDSNDDQIYLDNRQFIDNILSSHKIYYNLTHAINEQVKEQPAMLENGTLKTYQLGGLQWLVSLYNNNLNGILADQMGLGKTIQTISLFCYLIEKKKNYGPFLIIVPLSTISNWVFEFDKWAPTIKKIVYKGNQSNRAELAKLLKTSKWNVCITTYDFILKDKKTLIKFQWKYIVVDEGHRMKNAKSKFTTYLQEYNSCNRLLLTGTPLQNNLGQLWSLLNFLLPKIFESCDDFQKWFNLPIHKQSLIEQTKLSQQEQLLIINRLHQVLRPFLLRRKKKEVQKQIPEKKEFVIRVQLSSWQKIIQKNIKLKCVRQFDTLTGKSTSGSVMNNLMMQLRKCCNHPYLFLTNFEDLLFNDWIFRSSGKFQILDRILPKLLRLKHRVLIFSQMTQLMNIMQYYFDYRGIKHLRLDGSTKSDDRGLRMVMFNQESSEYDVFLLSTRAGGIGLNLQAADTVIIFDSDWNPHMDIQAMDRAHRIGQQNQVRVLILVTNTWIQQAAYKKDLDEMYIESGLFNQKSTESQQKQRIEDFLKKRNQFDDLQNQIPDDQQINQFLARSEEEFDIYQAMDLERYQREKNLYKGFVHPRLIREEEVPKWIKEPKAEAEKKPLGKGNRLRKEVNYVDQLTDQQFAKLIQEGAQLSIQTRAKNRKKLYIDQQISKQQ